ncbi:myosin-11 isoform X2 [Procambarus clarkii]
MSTRMDSSMHTWAVSLTRHHRVFSNDQPLTPEHFSKLTRDKTLQPVFSFLMRHVRSPEERRLIKLNLKQARFRKQIKADQEMSASEERFRLEAAIVDAISAVEAEATEIQQLNQRKEELHQKEVEMKRRIMLMKVVQEERDKEVDLCLSWSPRLCNLIEKDYKKDNKDARADLVMQLRGNFLDLERLHHSIIRGRLSTPDSIHQQKVRLCEQIKVTLDDWNPRMLMDGILSEARENTRNLHSKVQCVDLARDAHELRLKCESDGSFVDEMNPGGVIESVRELLGHMSAAHVKLYLEAHIAHQAAQTLTGALNALNNNISAVAKRTYSDDGVAAAVMSVVKENISLVGEQAALNTAQTLTASLQERADVAAEARDALRAKHAKIMSFNKEVQDEMESIQCLAANIHVGWQNIKDRVVQLKSSISEALSSTVYPSPVSPHSLANECEVFTSVPLAYLLTTNVESELKQKDKMSTTALTWYDQDTAEAGWAAVSQLCSGMHCWDGVYNTVLERLNMMTSLHNQLEYLGTVKEEMHSSQKKTQILSIQEMKELIRKVEQHDKSLHEEVNLLTETFQQKLSEGSKLLATITKLFNDWWEQPAKSIKLLETK